MINRREALVTSGTLGVGVAGTVTPAIAADSPPARLSLNENAFGLSLAVQRAVARAIRRIKRYADESDAGAFGAFVRDAASRTLVIVDESYLDYDDRNGRSAVRWTRAGANVVVFRAFAKILGLAGLPFGYAVAPRPLAESLHAPGIGAVHAQSRIALVATSAALLDRAWTAEVRERMLAGRARLTAALDALGPTHSNSRANFVFFRSPLPAGEVRARLLRAGINVARAFPPLNDGIRIIFGTEAEVTRSIAARNAIFAKVSAT